MIFPVLSRGNLQVFAENHTFSLLSGNATEHNGNCRKMLFAVGCLFRNRALQ
jgi:hypothetical protein